MVRPPVSGPWDYRLLSGIGSAVTRIPSLLPDGEDELPPLLISTEEDDGDGVCVFHPLIFFSSETKFENSFWETCISQTNYYRQIVIMLWLGVV